MVINAFMDMQVAESCELVCDVGNIEVLCDEYQKTDTIYQLKIQVTKSCLLNTVVFNCILQDLKTKYSKLRKTRGDGNCFFRAFAFGFMERAITDSSIIKP